MIREEVRERQWEAYQQEKMAEKIRWERAVWHDRVSVEKKIVEGWKEAVREEKEERGEEMKMDNRVRGWEGQVNDLPHQARKPQFLVFYPG